MNTNLLDSALKILSLRPHSKQEVINFLRKKTGDDTLINRTIEKLENSKLINDAEFAKWYIESRSRSRPRSQRMLSFELQRKGILMTTYDNSMTINDTQLAELALERKKNIKSREQAVSFLYSRGFSWSAIEPAIKKRYNPSHVS